jgi:NTP pyrophosphatase (non-canonical NTP hydrolase)
MADVLAWLCTLANLRGIDLTAAVREKYFGDRPLTGTK